MSYAVVISPGDPAAYDFRGGNAEMIYCNAPQAMLAGPSDSGKTFTCCAKVHMLCCRYAGSQHSIVRKTFSSLAGSVCQTYERVAAGAGLQILGADTPRLYTYPNGSQVWLGGMDKPEKTLSSERDTIYVPQAEQLTLNEWELLARAVSGRSAIVDHPQLFGDCNPAGSKHWIREHAKTGKMILFASAHRDNPTIYHRDGTFVQVGEFVHGHEMKRSGEERLKTLSDFTGVRRKRLFEGVWATAEGAVYDNFDANVHVMSRSADEFKRWLMCQDSGFTNPAVILLVGEDTDGRWHIAREFYQTGQLREAVVKVARQWFAEFKVELDVVDAADPELVKSLRNVGVNARPGKGGKKSGIEAIRDRLKVQGDGRPRLTVDPGCAETINEFESYIFKEGSEDPVKENDHAMDCLRYLEDEVGSHHGGPARVVVPAFSAVRVTSKRGETMM